MTSAREPRARLGEPSSHDRDDLQVARLAGRNNDWLVIDDVHELGPAEAGRQLKLLVMRGPLELRLVLATSGTCGWACASCGGGAVVLGSRTLTAPDTEQSCQGPRVP